MDRFLRQKYLRWHGSLGILGCVSEGVTAILKLEDLFHVSDYPNSKNTPILTRHFVEKRTITGPARLRSRHVSLHSILQTYSRK